MSADQLANSLGEISQVLRGILEALTRIADTVERMEREQGQTAENDAHIRPKSHEL